MHTMFDWNRDKTADLAEPGPVDPENKIQSVTRLEDGQLWSYDTDLSLSQSGDLL